MSDAIPIVKFEIEQAARRMTHAFLLSNEKVGAEMKSAIDKFAKDFDFEKMVLKYAEEAINNVFRSYFHEAVKRAVDVTMRQQIDDMARAAFEALRAQVRST